MQHAPLVVVPLAHKAACLAGTPRKDLLKAPGVRLLRDMVCRNGNEQLGNLRRQTL